MIPFAEWAPDRSELDMSVSDTISNVIPKAASYGPFPAFVPIATALPAKPLGLFQARDTAGAYTAFAGTATKLYKFNATDLDWDDVSKTATSYTMPGTARWSFAQFGSFVIAVNGSDAPQTFVLGTSTLFDDLAGSPPTATYVGVVGDFVALLNTTTSKREMYWSGLNNAEWWTPAQRLSDFQVFPDHGDIVGIAPRDQGAVIFQETCVRVMSPVDDPRYIFQFSKIDETRAITAPRSVVSAGAQVFYLTDSGFYQFGNPPVPIGIEKVDRWFFDDASAEVLNEVEGAADPVQKVVYWRYRSSQHANTNTTDKVLIYNYGIGRWSIANVELSGLAPMSTIGTTLEALSTLGYSDLDLMSIPLDSRLWTGGLPLLAGFDAAYRYGFFTGAPAEAVMQTADFQATPGRRSFVNGFQVMTDADTIQGRIATKDRSGSSRAWKASKPMQSTGLIPARADGRFHRIEITIPETTLWNHAHGVEVETGSGNATR